MASIVFTKIDDATDQHFYIKMRTEVMSMFKEFDATLMYYKGTFEVTIEKIYPSIKYTKQPGEFLNEELLKAHLLFFTRKLQEIAVALY